MIYAEFSGLRRLCFFKAQKPGGERGGELPNMTFIEFNSTLVRLKNLILEIKA